MDATQRVILFTTDQQFTELTRKEASGMEIFAVLSGIQVSIINNDNLEIATVSITGSNAEWKAIDDRKVKRLIYITKKYAGFYHLFHL